MPTKRLQEWFDWVQFPIICNGPMIGAACPALAAEVTKAGGIGFNPCTYNVASGSAHLEKLDAELTECRELLGLSDGAESLPIGASFITGHASVGSFLDTVLPILAKHRPAAIWLFAPDGDVKPHGRIIQSIKSLEHGPKVFVQVGNVTVAREAVIDGADVLVCQGVDAGGHQYRRGMGVISLVPTVRRMLREEFLERKVAVIAAGGIANGDGVAAAVALGAEGVVMGTRFTVSKESIYPQRRKQLVIDTADGGIGTLKSPFNDEINNNPLWGPLYDGRAIIGPVHEKFLRGSSLEDCQRSLKEDYSQDEATYVISTWAGTGVGLVNKEQSAGDIVAEVRRESIEVIESLATLL